MSLAVALLLAMAGVTGCADDGTTGARDAAALADVVALGDSFSFDDANDGAATRRDGASGSDGDAAGGAGDAATGDAGGPCPADMVHIAKTASGLAASYCIDRYEAPNVKGGLPLVMYHFDEAAAWCAARGKRLCFDDEWQHACEGPSKTRYPYGNTRNPGQCTDNKIWRVYSQSKLSLWPSSAASPTISSLAALFSAAAAASASGKTAADHVQSLYQATPAGAATGCGGHYGVYDLQGNVEEWTRRRDGGSGKYFNNNLKGRYWAEARTCQSGVKSHGDLFRFYEIGFRCCKDAP